MDCSHVSDMAEIQRSHDSHTSVIHVCIILFVRNQCKNDPSGGIMCGYCLVFCASRSCSASGAPGYCRGVLRSRAGCEGGLKRAGFSRTRGLLGAEVEARRVVLRAARRYWMRASLK